MCEHEQQLQNFVAQQTTQTQASGANMQISGNLNGYWPQGYCPYCNRCPHCSRPYYQPYFYYQQPYFHPYYQQPDFLPSFTICGNNQEG